MYSNERALCGIVNYEEAFNQCSPTGKFIQKKYIIDRKVLFFVQNFELCKITN